MAAVFIASWSAPPWFWMALVLSQTLGPQREESKERFAQEFLLPQSTHQLPSQHWSRNATQKEGNTHNLGTLEDVMNRNRVKGESWHLSGIEPRTPGLCSRWTTTTGQPLALTVLHCLEVHSCISKSLRLWCPSSYPNRRNDPQRPYS